MKADARRKEIVSLLLAEGRALSGSMLSETLGVSRQIIVQDIALLRAAGFEILSTHQGYVIHKTPLVERVIKVHHTKEKTEDELACIVKLGGTVVDVFVWHKVYGKIEAKLNIASMFHLEQYLEGIRSGKSSELMSITGGYHYHTIRAESEEVLDAIEKALEARGYIAPGE